MKKYLNLTPSLVEVLNYSEFRLNNYEFNKYRITHEFGTSLINNIFLTIIIYIYIILRHGSRINLFGRGGILDTVLDNRQGNVFYRSIENRHSKIRKSTGGIDPLPHPPWKRT